MAIQLVNRPEIKITLNNGEMFADFAPNFSIESFSLTRKLLEPNKFEFTFSKNDITLEIPDIKFDLREQLLGAKVECSVKANRLGTDGDWHIDEVENLFYGYIQHIKLDRAGVKSKMRVHCTAFSPDARMKQFPSCSSRTASTLKEYVEAVLLGYSDAPHKFVPEKGDYDEMEFFCFEVDPKSEGKMPYTVQYHESDYDFLKRLAKRYGEFFYFEDGTIRFGKMKEYDPVTLRTGVDLEQYDYDLNMNQHTGIVLSEFDYIMCNRYAAGVEKGDAHNWDYKVEPTHEMSKSVFDKSTEFYNNNYNAVSDSQSARIMDEINSCKLCAAWEEGDQASLDAKEYDFWSRDQRRILEQYIMADSLICRGVARRADLKLGSVIVIEDETNLGGTETNDFVQHEPLKVIGLTYSWSNEASRALENTFVAIPQSSPVPPYLERDEHGFLTYGDFDIYPKCGPQHAKVIDVNDPLGMGRVRVVMNWQYEVEHCLGIKSIEELSEHFTPWIRVAQPYGGLHRGCYLVPEVYDEVVVGFEHNNAERPYVMGTVHNWCDDEPASEWTEEESVAHNEYKAIRTRNGHTIEIRDKEEHGYIRIYDEATHNYEVVLDTDKQLIRISSSGNLELNAGHNIALHAGNDIIVGAGRDMETMVGNDKRLTVQKDQVERILGHRIVNISESDQNFVDKFYVLAVNTDDQGNLGTRLVMNDEMLYATYIKDNSDVESMVLLNQDGGQIATNIPRGMVSVKSVQGETEVVSEASNVSINSKAKLELNADVAAEISGQVVKIN